MGINLTDIITLCVLPLGALIFLTLAFMFRGMWWWSMLSGLLWILFGYNSINTVPIFAFERELGVVWIVIGIAVFWLPAWYKKDKDNKTLAERAAEADGEYESEEDKLDREMSRMRTEKWRKMRGRS